MDAYAFSSWPTELTALLDWSGVPLDMASLAALAAGLGWASGLRLYALVFVLGALGRFGGVQLPGGLEVLTHPLLLGVSGVMLLAEFFADKLPWFDSMWDAVHTFIRIPAGAALAAAVMGDRAAPCRWRQPWPAARWRRARTSPRRAHGRRSTPRPSR